MTSLLVLFVALLAPPDAVLKALAAEDAARDTLADAQQEEASAAAEVHEFYLAQADAEKSLKMLRGLLERARKTVDALEQEANAHKSMGEDFDGNQLEKAHAQPKLRREAALAADEEDSLDSRLADATDDRAAAASKLSTPPGPTQIARLEAALVAEQSARDALERAKKATREKEAAADLYDRESDYSDLYRPLLAEIGRTAKAHEIAKRAVADLQKVIKLAESKVEAAKAEVDVGHTDEAKISMAVERLSDIFDTAVLARKTAIRAAAESVGP